MALSQAGWIAITTALLGLLSFVFGVIGENKKPAKGFPATHGGKTVCIYPSDPSIALGALSVIFLFFSSILGITSIFFPYNLKPVPLSALARSTMLVIFTILSFAVFFVAELLLMWATIVEGVHRTHNVHSGPISECPTAKTGLMGGAAFLGLDATLFWLICQMLTMNARDDYFSYDEDEKGSYTEVIPETAGAAHAAGRA